MAKHWANAFVQVRRDVTALDVRRHQLNVPVILAATDALALQVVVLDHVPERLNAAPRQAMRRVA